MASDDSGARHSKAESASLVDDEEQRAKLEARNALLQFDCVLALVDDYLSTPEKRFRLRPSMIQSLHREALRGLSAFAGNWRPAGVEIGESKHTPPGAHLVAELVEDMCDYVNDNWAKSAIHLAAYVMWRLNWIHPFDDGNGRTSRAVSYLVLCVRSGLPLPGRDTIPEQIAANKNPYYAALEVADAADRAGQIDVSALEALMSDYLAKQLVSVYNSATGEGAAAEERAPKFPESARQFHRSFILPQQKRRQMGGHDSISLRKVPATFSARIAVSAPRSRFHTGESARTDNSDGAWAGSNQNYL